MNKITIFNNSFHEIDNYIVCYLGNKDLVSLSLVDKAAYQILDSEYFHTRFDLQHPLLKERKNKFQILTKFHPNSCWKVACCALGSSNFSINTTFAKTALPAISKFCTSQKEELMSRKIQLEDDICMASDDVIKVKQAERDLHCIQLSHIENKQKELLDACASYHTEEEIEQILAHYIEPNEQDLMLLTDEQLYHLAVELSGNDGFLKREALSLYLDAFKLRKEWPDSRLQELKNLYYKASMQFDDMLRLKENCEQELSKVNQKINLMDISKMSNDAIDGAMQCHAHALKRELDYEALVEVSILQKQKLMLFSNIISDALEKDCFVGVINQIKEIIDSWARLTDCTGSSFDPNAWPLLNWYADGILKVAEWTDEQYRQFLTVFLTIEIGFKLKKIESILNCSRDNSPV